MYYDPVFFGQKEAALQQLSYAPGNGLAIRADSAGLCELLRFYTDGMFYRIITRRIAQRSSKT